MKSPSVRNALLGALVVALGQPATLPILCPLAATCGYGLFWQCVVACPGKKSRFCWSAAWFALISLVQLSWMASLQFQGVYILAIWALLALWLGLQFGLFCLLLPKEGAMRAGQIVGLSCMWTLLEWSRQKILCGFSWNPVGLAWTFHPLPMQAANLFGVLGLSYLVVATNCLAYNALVTRRIRPCVWWLGLVLLPLGYGWAHLRVHEKQFNKHQSTLEVLLVQTGLLPSQKLPLAIDSSAYMPPIEQWKQICQFLKTQHAQLVVLPESAVACGFDMPLYPLEEVRGAWVSLLGEGSQSAFPPLIYPYAKGQMVTNAFWAQSLANRLQAEVIAGFEAHEAAARRSFNAAFHFFPDNQPIQRYEKQILVPLGEYLPFSWLQPLARRYGIASFFTPGRENRVSGRRIPVSVSICYEETFGSMIRRGRRLGAQLLVNITNDNYFPYLGLPLQHFTHARVRAVENGAPLLRACNTGVTAAVDSLGRLVGRLESDTGDLEMCRGALGASLCTYHYRTAYTFWGDGPLILFCIAYAMRLFLIKIGRLGTFLPIEYQKNGKSRRTGSNGLRR